MNFTNTADRPLIEALAGEVREILSEQERYVFDLLWPEGLKGSKAILIALSETFPEMKEGAANQAVHGTRQKLNDFFRSSRGISRPYRILLTNGARGRAPRLEVESNTHTGALAFWLGHLQNGRRTSIVMGEPYRNRNLGSGVFETSLSHRPKAVSIKPIPKPPTLPHPVPGMPLPPGETISTTDLSAVEVIENVEKPHTVPPSSPIDALLSGDPFRVVRLGDVRAALSIYSYFQDWHVKKLGYQEPDVISLEDRSSSEQDNLVVLGTTTADRALLATEWDARFNLCLADGNMLFERHTMGKRSGKGFGEYPRSCYVLVSRTGVRGPCTTLITGGHPTAVHEVCRLLTDEERVAEEIVRPLGLSEEWCASEEFQVVFGVHLTNDEKSVDSITAERFQTLEPRDIGTATELKVID